MSPSTPLDFLLVSSSYKTLTAVTEGLKQIGANLGFVPNAASARDYVDRRKLDGIFVDLGVPGALELIQTIRAGKSNRRAVIFACVTNSEDPADIMVVGANFVVHQPLTAESIASHAAAAQDVMVRERRRYFRYDINLPVFLKSGESEQRAMMVNLGEGGMAVRTVKPLAESTPIDFHFELRFGVPISGKGMTAWTNSEGFVGIKFNYLSGQGREHLQAWLANRQRLDPNSTAQEK